MQIETNPIPTILMVEDDDQRRAAFTDLLEERGYAVVGTVADGEEAIRISLDLEPDLVLIDVQGSSLGGMEAAVRIKSRLPLTQLLMFTADQDSSSRKSPEEAGLYAYLVRGCSPALVLDVLGHAWRYRREIITMGHGSRAAGRPV